jgi:predicted RNA-binding protein with PUA domain
MTIEIDLTEPGVVRLIDPADIAEIQRLAAENTRRAAERRRQWEAGQ